MFKSLSSGKRSGSWSKNGRDVANSLGYAFHTAKKRGGSKQVTFYVGKNLAKKARLIKGDRIDILYDEESNLGLLKRCVDRGNTLCNASKNCFQLQYTATTGPFPAVAALINLENVTVEDEGVLFAWPTQKQRKEERRPIPAELCGQPA